MAAISPLITHTIRRFGDWYLDLTPPEATVSGLGYHVYPKRLPPQGWSEPKVVPRYGAMRRSSFTSGAFLCLPAGSCLSGGVSSRLVCAGVVPLRMTWMVGERRSAQVKRG